jgi:O-antigen/teichoic acid export membrane protein
MLAFAIAWFSPLVLSSLGEKFRSDRNILAWVALGSAFSGMYFFVVVYVFYSKRNELLSITSVTIGVANLVLSYFLVGKYGAIGAAQAYAASQFLLFLIVWMIASRCCPMPWRMGLSHLLSKNIFRKS